MPATGEPCGPECLGWAVFNEDDPAGLGGDHGGEVQRCDACSYDDAPGSCRSDAAALVRAAQWVVDVGAGRTQEGPRGTHYRLDRVLRAIMREPRTGARILARVLRAEALR